LCCYRYDDSDEDNANKAANPDEGKEQETKKKGRFGGLAGKFKRKGKGEEEKKGDDGDGEKKSGDEASEPSEPSDMEDVQISDDDDSE
jgi:hypothetical protein